MQKGSVDVGIFVHLFSFEDDPYACFIFGDFNFRLDTQKVFKVRRRLCWFL